MTEKNKYRKKYKSLLGTQAVDTAVKKLHKLPQQTCSTFLILLWLSIVPACG